MMFLVLMMPVLFYLLIDQTTINHLVEIYRPQTKIEYSLWFLCLMVAMTIGLPRQIAAFSSGYLLGTVSGAIFATLAASCACLLTFISARFIFHQSIKRRFPEQLNKLNIFFTHDVFIKAFTIRLIPAGSNFLTNVLAGTAKAPLLRYLGGSTLGFIPQMTLFSMLGAGIYVGDNQQVLLSAILLVIALVLIAYLVKKR
ncbi:TVP38/TMEM64 family protein [Thalassotalea piscium]